MKMQRPEFEIIAFAAEDVIITSGGVTRERKLKYR